jgi:hypothetical protein
MKRFAIFLSSIVVLSAALLLYFYPKESKIDVWKLLPASSILVYESSDCSGCIKSIRNIFPGKVLFDSPGTRTLDSLFSTSSLNNQYLISVHVAGTDRFEIVYYFPANKTFNGYTKNLAPRKREFNGVSIYEYSVQGSNSITWTFIENHGIASSSSFLIEDVIRTYKEPDRSGFIEKLNRIKGSPRISNDAGNIYLDFGRIDQLIQTFGSEKINAALLDAVAVLDVKAENESIILNGFTTLNEQPSGLLSYFIDQSPTAFNHKHLISNRAHSVTNFGITSGSLLHQKLMTIKSAPSASLLSQRVSSSLFDALGGEISICWFEPGYSERVILVDMKEPSVWLKQLDQLSKENEKEDTLYFEKYAEYEIREIELPNLPGLLFSPLCSGFGQTYYTVSGKTLFMAERVEDLKAVLNDIDQDEVWGKSLAFNRFLETTLLESNVNYFINTASALASYKERLNSHWKDQLVSNRKAFSSLGLMAIQFSSLNGSFYTNMVLSTEQRTQEGEADASRAIHLGKPVVVGPQLVRNHSTKKMDFIVQDRDNTISYFSLDGKMQWQLSTDGPIIDQVSQIDYFKNGKLQLAFVTPGQLHVVDRLGNYVSGFPKNLDATGVKGVELVDYDNSRNYRIVLTDKDKLWMLDKDGISLEGWQPKLLKGDLLADVRHFRIRGKDYLMAVQKEGRLFLFNRRGEIIPGFPVDLKAHLSGDYHFVPGTSLAGSSFTFVAHEGLLVAVGPDGKIQSREPLVKSSVEDRFQLVREAQGKGYVIARQNPKSLTFLSEKGIELFSSGFFGNSALQIKYHRLAGNREVIIVTDLTEHLSFVYDGKGNLLIRKPLEGVANVFVENSKLAIVSVVEDMVSIAWQPF